MTDLHYEWNRVEERALAKYIQPEDLPEAFRLRNVSVLELRKYNKLGGVAEQLYKLICERSIKYDGPPTNFDKNTQYIRKPKTIFDDGRGTCLDLAVLFATMCLSEGLLPLLVVAQGVKEGHAFVGISLTQIIKDRQNGKLSPIAGGMFTNIQLKMLQELVTQEKYLFVECTGAAESHLWSEGSLISYEDLGRTFPENLGRNNKSGQMPFERACEAGRDQLLQHATDSSLSQNQRKFLYALDVYELQQNQGFKPVEAMITSNHRTLSEPESFSQIKIKGLEERRVSLIQDHQAATKQLISTLGAVDRQRIKRQIEDLENELSQIDADLKKQ